LPLQDEPTSIVLENLLQFIGMRKMYDSQAFTVSPAGEWQGVCAFSFPLSPPGDAAR